VLATLTAGVMLGNIGSLGVLTDRGREAVVTFWEYIAFAANSLIFLLIGLPLAHEDFRSLWVPTVAIIFLVLVSRAVSVYGCCALFAGSPKLRVTAAHQHVLFWGGLRGALALALVLGLPEATPLRTTLITVAFGVVAFSIIVPGLTMLPLLRRLGQLGSEEPEPAATASPDTQG